MRRLPFNKYMILMTFFIQRERYEYKLFILVTAVINCGSHTNSKEQPLTQSISSLPLRGCAFPGPLDMSDERGQYKACNLTRRKKRFSLRGRWTEGATAQQEPPRHADVAADSAAETDRG